MNTWVSRSSPNYTSSNWHAISVSACSVNSCSMLIMRQWFCFYRCHGHCYSILHMLIRLCDFTVYRLVNMTRWEYMFKIDISSNVILFGLQIWWDDWTYLFSLVRLSGCILTRWDNFKMHSYFNLLIWTSTWFADCNWFGLSKQVKETKQVRFKELAVRIEEKPRREEIIGSQMCCHNTLIKTDRWWKRILCFPSGCWWFILLMKPIFCCFWCILLSLILQY